MIKIKKIKNKNLIFADNLIFLNTNNNFNGNLFYTAEYSIYLNIPAVIIANNKSFITKVKEIFKKKYKKKLWSKIDHNLYFFDENTKILANKLLVLDFSSVKNFYFFEAKKIFFNYGDYHNSIYEKIEESFYFRSFYQKYKNKLIFFGDKRLSGNNVDYHFPLSINFEMFKEIKNFDYQIFNEIKISNKLGYSAPVQRKKIFSDHSEFYILNFYKKNFYDRANRLILECKFYNKEINIYNQDSFIDSISIRSKSPWQEYDLKGSNFDSFFKGL